MGRAGVDTPAPQRELDVFRVMAGDLRGHDGAELRTPIQYPNTGDRPEAIADILGQVPRPVACGVETDLQGIARRGAEAEYQGVGKFPGLEAACISSEVKSVGLGPGCSMHVGQQRMRPALEHPIGHVEEAETTRA